MIDDVLKGRRNERAGRSAEWRSAWLLRLKGYMILHRRYATPVGEIDIIARRGDVLAFVEVKRRQTLESALDALDKRQCQRIERAAMAYLKRYPSHQRFALRFDLLATSGFRLVHVEDAFRPGGDIRHSW